MLKLNWFCLFFSVIFLIFTTVTFGSVMVVKQLCVCVVCEFVLRCVSAAIICWTDVEIEECCVRHLINGYIFL